MRLLLDFMNFISMKMTFKFIEVTYDGHLVQFLLALVFDEINNDPILCRKQILTILELLESVVCG